LPSIWRTFYEIELPPSIYGSLDLQEGAQLGKFSAQQLLTHEIDITPYDAFALWFHINRRRLRRR